MFWSYCDTGSSLLQYIRWSPASPNSCQKIREAKQLKQLNVARNIPDVTPEELKYAQELDSSLIKLEEMAKSGEEKQGLWHRLIFTFEILGHPDTVQTQREQGLWEHWDNSIVIRMDQLLKSPSSRWPMLMQSREASPRGDSPDFAILSAQRLSRASRYNFSQASGKALNTQCLLRRERLKPKNE